MSKSFEINISHSLGQAEVQRRIEAAITQFRETFGSRIHILEERWVGPHLDFRVGFMGQTVSGTLDVAESYVRVEVNLPMMLAYFANKLKSMMTKKGQLLLEHR